MIQAGPGTLSWADAGWPPASVHHRGRQELCDRNSSAAPTVQRQVFDGVEVLRCHTHPAIHRSYAWRVVSFFSFMISSVYGALRVKDVDVVFGTSPPIFQAASAWLVSAIRRRPFLLEVRDLWPEFAIDIGLLRNPILVWLSRRLESFLYARAVHIVVNSPAYRDYLLEKGVPPRKISVIANGVDAAMFRVDAPCGELRKEFHLEGKFLVSYAGTLGMANDLDTLLDAAASLAHVPKIHFLLVGDGKDHAVLKSRSQQLGLTNVTFAGARPKQQMPEILAESDACIAILRDIPMFRTTYPNKVFDYMAASRPTILCIDGVIRRVIEAADGGVFAPPGSAAALADAVLSLYRDPQRARQMGESARRYVAEHFDRNQQASQFLELLGNLVQRGADAVAAKPAPDVPSRKAA